MKVAHCMIRDGAAYRRERFHLGLKRLGFTVSIDNPHTFRPDDVVVIWNRYGTGHDLALRAAKAGAAVIVAENGYFARPKEGGLHYALARDGHNGAGRWPAGDGARWAALGVELKPWRQSGSHIVVAPNRHFGQPGFLMPADWPNETVKRLRAMTKREIRFRQHPGNDLPRTPMAEDLRDAWCTVVWQSSFGVHSLVAGVPVICCGRAWVAKGAAGSALEEIENPPMPDRLPHFESLAWAQASFEEIESGEAFARLMAI